MTYEIFRNQNNILEVHKPGCRDVVRHSNTYRFTTEAQTMEELVIDEFDCHIEETEGSWENYLSEFKVMPCAGKISK